jgi:hypothetical protein
MTTTLARRPTLTMPGLIVTETLTFPPIASPVTFESVPVMRPLLSEHP